MEADHKESYSGIIKVIGVGGAGFNAVSRMMSDPLNGVKYAVIDTDSGSVSECPKVESLIIGEELTGKNGTGGNLYLARQAAEQSIAGIRELIADTGVLILSTGLGGGTGTGAIPVIAKLAKEMSAYTIAVVTLPFKYEGADRVLRADEGIVLLKDEVDVLITVRNEELNSVVKDDASFNDAMVLANSVLVHTVKEVSRIQSGKKELILSFEKIEGFLKGADERFARIARVVRGGE